MQHDTVTMNSEKPHGIPKRRPLSSIGTQSPKLGGKSISLPKVAGPQSVHNSPVLRMGSKVEEYATQDAYRDDSVATPVKAFLNSNITPRSGSRKARVETASPNINWTPNGTPTTSRPTSSHNRHDTTVDDARTTSGLGLRISNAGRKSRSGSMISDGPGTSSSSRSMLVNRHDSFMGPTSPESAPKFFRADDVKPTVTPMPVSEASHLQSRLPTYAPAKEDVASSGRMSSMSNDSARDEQRGSSSTASGPHETTSSQPRVASGNNSNRPPLQTIYSEYDVSSPPQVPSPLKEEILPRKTSTSKASPRRHTRLVSNGGSELKSPEAIIVGNGDLSRRSSLNAAKITRYNTHTRSSSVHSPGPGLSRRPSIALSDICPIERVRTTSLVGANGALPHSVNPPSMTQELPDYQSPSQPQSPTKTTVNGHSKIDQMNELAAKARRERKVLDLEISNSSLLAINRTLEREMRTQNAELRRYRRLSRSGRISLAPASRSTSAAMSILSKPNASIRSDDLVSSTDEDDDATDLPSTVSLTFAASRPSSPTERAARTRFQDPTCVKIDLSAHRALLLESQKLNLAIKRCLGHTESLILSGRRALEYRAIAPEPENLGPRVLTPDESQGDGFSGAQGLLSPSLDQTAPNPWERSLGSAGSLDSGLETPDYSKWGHSTAGQTPFMESAEAMEPDLSDGAELEHVTKAGQGSGIETDYVTSVILQDEVRRASMVASIDGLDDDSETDAKSYTHEQRPILTTQGTNPDSYAARAERKEGMKPPDLQPGQAGYRGSMQNLGHYLQAFSIFGTSQPT